jgi:hypothetical protein
MNLRQQIIQDRIDSTARLLSVDEDMAFLRFAHSIIVGQSIHSFDPADLIEGSQEKQIDVITIEQSDGEAEVFILQVKNSNSFPSNALILMRNGLEWIFNRPRIDVDTLANRGFKDAILEYRSVQGDLGPSNIRIHVAFITNGLTSALRPTDEFQQEARNIQEQYDNGTFSRFTFKAWGADELVELVNSIERKNRKVDADISVRYDANNPSLVKYHAGGLKGVVCSTPAKEIARIVNNDPNGYIFDLNIRRFLGTRGGVNSDILRTCGSLETSRLFWFLNNGITIVCDSCDPVTDPDNPHVKIKNMQIVNGCQTASSLALAEQNGQLCADVRVLLRIYETSDPDLISKIVLTTNNQNQISNRDLRANDSVQLDMERRFQKYGYHYERKPRQYDGIAGVSPGQIVVNESVGQSYLAVVLGRPSDARARKYKIWGELYSNVFGGQIIEPYVLSVEVYRRAATWVRRSGHHNDSDDVRRKVANNGLFHVARATAYLWLKSDNWRNAEALAARIGELQSDQNILDCWFVASLSIIEAILKGNPTFMADLERALKSAALDTAIEKAIRTAPLPNANA